MNFALFILLNAILLIRPEELLAGTDTSAKSSGLRLYFIVIVLFTSPSFHSILSLLSLQSLKDRPITVCVLGLPIAISLSQIALGNIGKAFEQVAEFAKVVLYFLLLTTVVDTPVRLKAFLGWLVVFV